MSLRGKAEAISVRSPRPDKSGLATQSGLTKAKNYSYRLLSYRSRSCKEIRERLKRKKFSKKIVDRTIKELKELNYLNDREFSSTWVDIRLSAHPCGRRLVEQELRKKGIDEGIIEEICERSLSGDKERELAYNLALKKLAKLRNLGRSSQQELSDHRDDFDAKWKKLYSFLGRRGFPLELVHDVLNEVLAGE